MNSSLHNEEFFSLPFVQVACNGCLIQIQHDDFFWYAFSMDKDMNRLILCLVLVTLSVSVSNTQKMPYHFNGQNKIFIITLDGFRWEEIFGGADSLLINDPSINADTAVTKAMYWAEDAVERRKKLLPFFWNVIGNRGELYGNRQYNNKVNVANPYALSYPGYSELLTGSVDYLLYNNDRRKNSNENILQVLNNTEAYAGKVAAFTSWDMFPYILNRKEKNGFVLNSGLQSVEDRKLSASQALVNSLQGDISNEEVTRYDELTFVVCREYIEKNRPSVVLLSFSGTDNAAHGRHYDEYLQQANNADRMIGQLWQMVQSIPEYAGKTTFLITTDHGRGKKKSNWSDHGFFVSGSSQTWYALLGNTVVPKGEMKMENQAYQKELSSLVQQILARP